MKINKTFETDYSRFVLRLEDFNSVLSEEAQMELGNVVICDVALSNVGLHSSPPIVDTKAFREICEYLVSFLNDNPETILYFYCDDRNKPPRQRKRKSDMSMQRFRSELFHSFYERYVPDQEKIKEHILRTESQVEICIHLIYPAVVEEQANIIKNAISEQACK